MTTAEHDGIDVRLSAAIALAKTTAGLSRALRRGGGTTMPGRVARAVEPRVVGLLSRRLQLGTAVIAGTNGKTTTAHLLAHIMRALGVPLDRTAEAVGSFVPAFGRAERATVDGREVRLLLVKNPAGFNEVLRTVLAEAPLPGVLIAINDLTADGRDVSWLWDVDVEMLAGRVGRVVVTGIRAEDMALRLRYAGVPPDAIEVERGYDAALRRALALATSGRLYVLPTYTAMLALRDVLRRWGAVKGFWET